VNSSVTGLELKAKSGYFKATLKIRAKVGSDITLSPPNPGSYGGAVVTINGPGGDSYCMNFGGAAGGVYGPNDAKSFKIKKPTTESVCPSVSPTCGDGTATPPFETCDVGDDAVCPGLCGANGIACECPFCGDSVQDPGEECDGSATPPSCTLGCTHQCVCATCGDNVAQAAEDCDGTDDFYCPGQCGAAGGPLECKCPACGDGTVNTPSEECEETDDAACRGQCIPAGETNECRCAVCGNNVVEVNETCDGTDDAACSGLCLSDCTCPLCGNEVLEPGEQCDGPDDAACPDLCQDDCTCP
jgi:hypothetical protein